MTFSVFITILFLELIFPHVIQKLMTYAEPCQTSKMELFDRKSWTALAEKLQVKYLTGFYIRLWKLLALEIRVLF